MWFIAEDERGRRFLAMVPLTAATIFGSLYLTRSGLAGDWAAIPVAAVVWFPLIVLLDRVIVLERRGFWCRQCGYDLRGQINPQCPECGREFDPSETEQMELPDPADVLQRQKRKRNYLGLVLFIVLVAALTASAIILLRAYRAAKSRGTVPEARREYRPS